MRKPNKGKSEDDILQNRFTAYLITAIKRHKIRYLNRKDEQQQSEISIDEHGLEFQFSIEDDLLYTLSLLEQIENEDLLLALKRARERELHIFLTHIIEDRSFAELSKELGISYKAVTHLYYRFMDKIRKELGGDEK